VRGVFVHGFVFVCGEEECIIMLFLYAFYIRTVENSFMSVSSEILSCSYCVSFIVSWLVFLSAGNFCFVMRMSFLILLHH